jgi:hypothetical protein
MPRTADLPRVPQILPRVTHTEAVDNGDHASSDDEHSPAAVWIFGRKRLIPAAVIFNDWRRGAVSQRQRQRPR